MRIIEVESCKTCPYRSLTYSFANDMWTLACQKDTQKVSEHKLISGSKYTKEKLTYDIPGWCTLQEASSDKVHTGYYYEGKR